MMKQLTARVGFLCAASVLAMSFTLVSDPVLADDPGPVPSIKVDAKKAALGKRLFFDPRLSGDSELSCASCHDPEKGFTDGEALSSAYAGANGFRNVPTLINTAHKAAWFHDGRVGTNLNDITRESITETYNMNMDMRLMQERIKQDPVYVKMFKDAGYGEPSNGSVRNAIPEYLKTLISRGAPYDTGKMNAKAKAGFELFKGKAGCMACHSGDRFTDDKPHNIGTPDNPEIWADPERHITFITFAKFQGIEGYMNMRRDPGAYIRYHDENLMPMNSFMTPTLRELKQTAPYMHNGIFATLKDVVAFKNAGGGEGDKKDKAIKPLNLTEKEQDQLVAFLEALSGDVLNGPEFVAEEIDTDYTSIDNWREVKN